VQHTQAVEEVRRRFAAAKEEAARDGRLFVIVDLADLPVAAVREYERAEYGMPQEEREAAVRRWRKCLAEAKAARNLADMLLDKGNEAGSVAQNERATALDAEAKALAIQIGVTEAP
jgi:polysaccharide deacetylase 2 family uncharacterized protein YibQ